MGVLNVTPDSFFDGGRYLDHRAAVARGREMVAEGADIVDVGGESTRPGAAAGQRERSCAGSLPVVEALAGEVRVSIDTMKAAVADAALAAGATLVNDVSASLAEVAAEHGAGFVAMHMQGTPATCSVIPTTTTSSARSASSSSGRARLARSAGVDEVYVDPGIGFGKTVDTTSAPGGAARARAAGGRCSSGRAARASSAISEPAARSTVGSATRPPRPTTLRGLARHGCVGDGVRGGDGAGPRRRRHRRRRPVCSQEVSGMRGRWAAGIVPRNFCWIIRDTLAVSERPGGYAPNHRRVRRQEEILWLRAQGFTRVVSLLRSTHNLHAYDELGLEWSPLPDAGRTDDPRCPRRAVPRAARVARRR